MNVLCHAVVAGLDGTFAVQPVIDRNPRFKISIGFDRFPLIVVPVANRYFSLAQWIVLEFVCPALARIVEVGISQSVVELPARTKGEFVLDKKGAFYRILVVEADVRHLTLAYTHRSSRLEVVDNTLTTKPYDI